MERQLTIDIKQFSPSSKQNRENLDNLSPVSQSIKALPHSPAYRMHRYFARRPYNVFYELIKHYTNDGDIILDPFCGGGVTVIEGLRLRRKVMGVDINPMATFITRCEAMEIDLEVLIQLFRKIEENISKDINKLYTSTCPRCKESATAIWIKWAKVYKCPGCHKNVDTSLAKKIGAGKYRCPYCSENFRTTTSEKRKDIIVSLYLICLRCGYRGEKTAEAKDVFKANKIDKDFGEIISNRELWYPKDKMPRDYDLRRPYNLDIERFCDFLSKRNLLACSMLYKEIGKIKDKNLRYFLLHIFTSTLAWVTKMSVDAGHGWAIHAYWLANVYFELNVWAQFKKRFEWALKGKRYSNKEIGKYFKETKNFKDLLKEDSCMLLTQPSTKLPIPDNSVDAIITDPPYGGNVMYSELCNFWAVWLKETFGLKGLIDNAEEAIKSEFQRKGDKEYEELLYKVFRECYRVLKQNRWMVMTFNNKESSVWIALLRAAKRAGFYLPDEGILYQRPVDHYTNTLYLRRDGSMHGDFIYSFQKKNNFPKEEYQNNGKMEKVIFSVAKKVILENGGATTTQIYQKLIPQLFNHNTLVAEEESTPNIETVLKEKFAYQDLVVRVKEKEKNTKKWTIK